jgi:hypothetical protein
MLKTKQLLSTLLLGTALLAGPASAAPPKSYEVTGPVVEVTDSTITVEKGKEKWQIARDKDTKVMGDIKVGDKVHIDYRMTATAIEVKGAAKTDAKPTAKDAKGAAKK